MPQAREQYVEEEEEAEVKGSTYLELTMIVVQELNIYTREASMVEPDKSAKEVTLAEIPTLTINHLPHMENLEDNMKPPAIEPGAAWEMAEAARKLEKTAWNLEETTEKSYQAVKKLLHTINCI